MLKYFFPVNFNFRYFFKKKNCNDVLEKKENPNLYKKLLDKNRSTYLNLAKENMVWFNNKMEKDYGKKWLKNSLFLCGNGISIIEPSIDEKEVIADAQDTINTLTVIQDDKKYNKNYITTYKMRYGPAFLHYTVSSFYGITSILIGLALIYYLTR
jgi:hypothetical protein